MNITIKKMFFCAAFGFVSNAFFAQDDLLNLVDDNQNEAPKKVFATFKTIRIGNAQSTETTKKKHLDFRIAHRFGNLYNSDNSNPINQTGQTFLGFDMVTDIRFSLEYGVTDNLTIGIGRSKMNHLIDGNIKWKFLEQTADFKIPVTMAFYSSTAYSHDPMTTIYNGVVKDFETNELHRFNFCNQLLIASKINSWLSLELIPTYMHRNFIKANVNPNNNAQDVNGFFSLGVGGRVKLNKRTSIVADYFFNFSDYYQNNPNVFNPLSIGIEMETGGHVFTFLFTNALGLIENNFIPYTTDTWTKGQVKLGFCISRTFAL